ncbi:LuxR C-terminal-related transcriptional regulator [Streptacidiphilus sp. PB12-B1b]|uniref:helix-turn-helix transcriptional regulator n=1 Tax=Streptacidiphilus sp. PB12-B1b TaxID=2705012 RepID=UPI001CDC4639|nr:LuxR C-terminal-related transcriptional regulator [Streptacidiphilus sp. PB12-B1b]
MSIHADDPFTRTGLATELRQRAEIELVDPPLGGSARVVVFALDTLAGSAFDLIRTVRSRDGAQAVLVVSALSDDDLLNVVESGVSSVVWRWEATATSLTQAVIRAASGDAALPADLLTRLLKQVGRLQQHVLRPQGLTLGGLSDRERRVLRLAAEGFDTDEIAGELAYSKRTVSSVLHDITVRYQLRNRTHAVAFAIREGLI